MSKSLLDTYYEFLETNPSDIEFEKFLYTGNTIYVLSADDIPKKFEYIYINVQRTKKYLDEKTSVLV